MWSRCFTEMSKNFKNDSSPSPLRLLLGRAYQHLVDGHPARPAQDVVDRLGDVHGLQAFDVAEPLLEARPDLRTVVAGQLGVDRARLDQRDPHMPAGDLLPQ